MKVLQIIFSGHGRMGGYIYLVCMADGVYKVGRTFHKAGPRIRRLEDYPGDSRTVYVRWCDDEIVTETRILKKCRTEFGPHLRGKEYFVGPEKRLIDIISQEIDGNGSESKNLLDSTGRSFLINMRGFLTPEDLATLKTDLGCMPYTGDHFYWQTSRDEHKVKTYFHPHNFSTVLYTRTGTPLRRLVDVMRALEARKFRVLSTEGFTWVDETLLLCKNSIERPRVITNSVDEFILHSVHVNRGPEHFAPLEVVKTAYENYCKRVPAYYYDFEDHCGLRIEKGNGDVTWTPLSWGEPRVFKSPWVVRGLTLTSHPSPEL